MAAVALAIEVEALGATAALGALFAPIVVGKEPGSVNLLLLYLGAMGAALGGVSASKRWRIAMVVVALAYFGVASSGILRHAEPAALYLYGILGGAAGLFIGLREGWPETRLLCLRGRLGGAGRGKRGRLDSLAHPPWRTWCSPHRSGGEPSPPRRSGQGEPSVRPGQIGGGRADP